MKVRRNVVESTPPSVPPFGQTVSTSTYCVHSSCRWICFCFSSGRDEFYSVRSPLWLFRPLDDVRCPIGSAAGFPQYYHWLMTFRWRIIYKLLTLWIIVASLRSNGNKLPLDYALPAGFSTLSLHELTLIHSFLFFFFFSANYSADI